jgi:hypothetical protein
MALRSAAGPAAIVLILTSVVACSGGGSGSPTAPASPTPAAPATDSASSSPTPVGLSGSLADLLPDEIGGIKLEKRTILGPDLGELEAEEAANIAKVLENVEGPPEAFEIVSATGEGFAIAAWRMEGTDGRQLGESFLGFISGLGDTKVEDVTIDGKDVKRVTPTDTTPLHIYVTGEIMFVVQAKDPALVAEAFALLP